MEARAVAKYMRIPPRKARQVARLIKGKGVDEAFAILQYTPRKAARLIAKVLKSAVANAENNLELDREDLYVARSYIDEGPPFKRIRPRARGMANRILRRTSHITVVVKEREED